VALLTLTVNNLASALDRKAQEGIFVARALQQAAHDIGAAGGLQTSGNILADGGAVIGSWVLTNQAAS
jgi:hypothetical protein